ncbi:MAG: hypothetical protein VB108_00540 [Anaerolineaceae bacterium]|nr:hypothetical protein [Anaerolineaceae bacterium]
MPSLESKKNYSSVEAHLLFDKLLTFINKSSYSILKKRDLANLIIATKNLAKNSFELTLSIPFNSPQTVNFLLKSNNSDSQSLKNELIKVIREFNDFIIN